MKIVSVNVSMPKVVQDARGHQVETGIFKAPVEGRVRVRTLNLEGDGQADLSVHGGVDKAVYLYPHAHYATWAAELGRDDLRYGQFGENLTVDGDLTEDAVHVGDIFRVGHAVLQVTQPRSPCFKLNLRMLMPTFGKLFLQSGRVGYYARVLEEGDVAAGDAIALLEAEPHAVSVRDLSNLWYYDEDNLELLQRAVNVEALSPGWRDGFAERLLRLTTGGNALR